MIVLDRKERIKTFSNKEDFTVPIEGVSKHSTERRHESKLPPGSRI